MISKRLEAIRKQLQPYQESKRLRDILDQMTNANTWDLTLSHQDLFELMTKETDPQRMYKLARLYIILVEEQYDE